MGRRLQMGLAFGDAPTGRKRGKQIPMRRYVTGQQVEPLANVGKRLIVLGQERDDPRQDVRMKSLESLTLPDKPGFEQGNAIGLETLEELALELRRQLFEEIEVAARSRRRDARRDPQRVDLDGGRIDGHPIVFGLHALVRRVAEQPADFGEAPAQLAARIVGDVPE